MVQHRLLRWAVEWSDLPYYGGLASSPGFIQLLWRLIQELTSAAVTPECLERALQGTEPRLAELGRIYRAYWEGARALGGADRLALIPMARDAIRRAPDGVLSDWLLLAFDGFDSLTPAQLDLVQVLAPRVPEMVVMLTGDVVPATPLVWRRFRRTQQDVERVLGIRAEPFPATFDPGQRPSLPEPALRDGGRAPAAHCAGVELLEAPDRARERALGWLKERPCTTACGRETWRCCARPGRLPPLHAADRRRDGPAAPRGGRRSSFWRARYCRRYPRPAALDAAGGARWRRASAALPVAGGGVAVAVL